MLLFLLLAAADGDLIERAACRFPSYEQSIERYATKSEYEAAIADGRFTCEKLTYSSDGLPVVAFYYREAGGQTRPVVVFNRGSWVVKQQLPLLVTMFRRLAEGGFAVLAPMYRGSEGAPGKDEMGGAELGDLFHVLPLAKTLGSLDVDNVFLYGESRGGVMCLMALRDGLPARAAATSGAFTDLAKYLEQDPRAKQAVGVIWPDYLQREAQILASRSAMSWAERIGAPLLMMHGAADRQVSPSHTFSLAGRLEELKKEYEVHVFGGDGHVLSGHRVERDQLAILWFKKHLKATRPQDVGMVGATPQQIPH